MSLNEKVKSETPLQQNKINELSTLEVAVNYWAAVWHGVSVLSWYSRGFGFNPQHRD